MLRKLLCLVAILGMTGMAYASIDWDGGGDGINWSDGNNWEDPENIPPDNDSWNINKAGYPLADWNTIVDRDFTTGSGILTAQSGYSCSVTVVDGVTLNMTGELVIGSGNKVTVESNASLVMGSTTYDAADQQINLGSGGAARLEIEADAIAGAGFLRHDNGSIMDVYGTFRTYQVTRIANDSGYQLNVYDGGLFSSENFSSPPYPSSTRGMGWPKWGKIVQYAGSTVQLQGDRSQYYKRFVKAGDAGEWQVDYNVTRSGYTTIKLNPILPPEPLWSWADPDDDGDVDQDDFAQFQACYSGDVNYPTEPAACANFDYVEDGKVNADDFAAFTACATGPGIPVNTSTAPDCAGLAMASWEAFGAAPPLGHLIGSRIPETSDWRCTTDQGTGFMSYGPYVRLQAGEYVARFYLRVDSITEGSPDDVIGVIDVFDADSATQLAGRIVYRSDFTAANEWQRFNMSFTQTVQDHDPAHDHRHEFRVYYGEMPPENPEDPPAAAYAQLDLDKVDLVKITTYERPAPPEPPVPFTPYTVSTFDADLEGWTASTWVAGTYGAGECVWSSLGHPSGSVMSRGAGTSFSGDKCTREGGIIQKAIDTTGRNNLYLRYDVFFTCRLEWSNYPSESGACPVLEGNGRDKVAVYCSTDGGANWTLLEQVYADNLDQAVWYTRQVKLPAEADNNPDFALKFQTQFNTYETFGGYEPGFDMGFLDNIGLSEGEE